MPNLRVHPVAHPGQGLLPLLRRDPRLLPDLIETGVDILNPVQVTAAGMETAALKRDFGRDLIFWGGVVDTQGVLHGTPEEVRDEVNAARRRPRPRRRLRLRTSTTSRPTCRRRT